MDVAVAVRAVVTMLLQMAIGTRVTAFAVLPNLGCHGCSGRLTEQAEVSARFRLAMRSLVPEGPSSGGLCLLLCLLGGGDHGPYKTHRQGLNIVTSWVAAFPAGEGIIP